MVVALPRGLNCTFCYSIIKGLSISYLEGLIHGGAFFRNFMVQSNLLNTDTKGTEPSVRFTEVSVL